MIILSHRGCWEQPQEKNTLSAFDRSFSLACGTETDLRDSGGELVISHDPADKDALSAELFFTTYVKHDKSLVLALNIKSDGLQKLLADALSMHQISNYFVFDMSIPDMISYINAGLRVFARQSEYEPNPSLYEKVQGIWVDCFHDDWFDESTIQAHINNGKQVCLVSPELHKRPYEAFWEKLKQMSLITSSDLMLCTDHPQEAKRYFDE